MKCVVNCSEYKIGKGGKWFRDLREGFVMSSWMFNADGSDMWRGIGSPRRSM